MTSIYIHIPFCSRICSYCDFPKKISKSQEIDTYLDCLYEEIKMYDVKDGVKTLYLGGGTPSILSTEQFKKLKKIISLFKLDASYEFTIECNPEHVTEEKVVMLKELGINRVSLGVQTFNDELLKILNRGHNKDTVYQAVDILRKKGIDNINLDLIFAIPNQTMKGVINDLKHIHKLNIPHISYYSFILEDKTVLHYLYQQNKLELVDNDIEAKMYLKVIKTLKKFYYMHYEISNFAQPGYS
ncbi:MAG TPA: radical SAM family heme chaperone HemW, partial [Haloplasmataceae bacterium]